MFSFQKLLVHFQHFSYLQKHQPVFDELKNVKELRATWEHKILAKSTWELLCSNPVHVFQLIKRLKYFEEYIDPLLKDTECKFRKSEHKNRQVPELLTNVPFK